jgi:hypothetical protein
MTDPSPKPRLHHARPGEPLEIVVDGTDGAGKTTCVQFLVANLADLGLTVAQHAPYRSVEVYPLWDTAPAQAAATITAVMQQFRAAHPHADILVWDRGWPTAFISTTDLRAQALFAPFPAATILLLSTTGRTRDKARTKHAPGEWVTDDALIERYHAAYHQLTSPPGHPMLRYLPDDNNMFDLPVIRRDLLSVLEAAPTG